MKICLVGHLEKVTGAARQVCLLAGALHKAGQEVLLVSLEGEEYLPCKRKSLFPGEGLVCRKIDADSLGRFFHDNRDSYDLVHFFGSQVNGSLIDELHKLNKPVVIRPAGFKLDSPEALARTPAGQKRLEEISRADAFVGISEPIFQSLLRSILKPGSKKDRIIKIVNGVDTEYYCPPAGADEKNELKRKLGFSPLDRLVLFVGGFHRDKGADLMISGWPSVRKAVPSALLAVAGHICTVCEKTSAQSQEPFDKQFERLSGLLTGKFSSLIENQEGIRFLGAVEEVREYLRAADLFWFPSRSEGLPNALLEAMSCGLPCVTSDIPEIIRDIIVDDSVGLAVKSEEYAQTIIQLLGDEEKRTCLGKKARQRMEKYFSMKQNLKAHLELYKTLLKGTVNTSY